MKKTTKTDSINTVIHESRDHRKMKTAGLLGAAGLAIALLASPFLAPVADAASDGGPFAVQADSDAGAFQARVGGSPEQNSGTTDPDQGAPAKETTTISLTQHIDWHAYNDKIENVRWVDGTQYYFDARTNSYPRGLPSFLKVSSEGGSNLECADAYDSCGVRVEVTDSRTGKVIATDGSDAIDLDGTEWYGQLQSNGAGFTANGFDKTVEGNYSAKEALALSGVPTFLDPKSVTVRATYFATKGGQETVMGIDTVGHISCYPSTTVETKKDLKHFVSSQIQCKSYYDL